MNQNWFFFVWFGIRLFGKGAGGQFYYKVKIDHMSFLHYIYCNLYFRYLLFIIYD